MHHLLYLSVTKIEPEKFVSVKCMRYFLVPWFTIAMTWDKELLLVVYNGQNSTESLARD